MTQRSVFNERSLADDHGGAKRKSAASAKPKIHAASTVSIDTGKKTPEQKKAARKAAIEKDEEKYKVYRFAKVPTRRYKILRAAWASFLILGLASVVVVFFFDSIFDPENKNLYYFFVGLSYAAIIISFFIDLVLVTKERRRYAEEMNGKSKAIRKAAKQAKQARDTQQNSSKHEIEKPNKSFREAYEDKMAEIAEKRAARK